MSQFERQLLADAIASKAFFNPMRWLLLSGLVRLNSFKTSFSASAGRWRMHYVWPVHVAKWPFWVATWKSPGFRWGFFRNRPEVVRDIGTWLPRRWGVYILGLEIGQRG